MHSYKWFGMVLALLSMMMLCSCATHSFPVGSKHPAHPDAETGMHTRSDTLSIRQEDRVAPAPEPMHHEMHGMEDM